MRTILVAAFAVATLMSAAAHADDTYYNGKKWDDRYGRAPKNFTGKVVVKDRSTGRIVKSYALRKDVKHGPFKQFDDRTGKLERVSPYRNGKRHGVERRYRDGKLEVEYTYVNGRAQGVQKTYREGKLARAYYTKTNGSVGRDLSFWPNGKLKSIDCGEGKISARDQRWCGFSGKPGKAVTYFENGNVRSVTHYVRGKRHGMQEKYAMAGKVMSRTRYENDKVAQQTREGRGRGGLEVKTQCEGKRCISTQYFKGTKKPKLQVTREKSKVLLRTEWYQNGQKKREERSQGDLVMVREYHDNGKLALKGPHKVQSTGYGWWGRGWTSLEGHGLVREYWENGKLRSEVNYRRGRHHGSAKHYWKTGSLRLVAHYEKGRVASRTVYDEHGKVESSEEFYPDGSRKKHDK